MAFTLFRSAATTAVLAVHAKGDEGSELFPVPGEVFDSVLLERSDGVPAVYRAIYAGARPRRSSGPQVRDVPIAAIVTDSRFVLASSAYAKPLQQARDGSMLVGHVRFGWCSWTRPVSHVGRRVRIDFSRPDAGATQLIVVLSSDADAELLCRDVLTRLTAFRRNA